MISNNTFTPPLTHNFVDLKEPSSPSTTPTIVELPDLGGDEDIPPAPIAAAPAPDHGNLPQPPIDHIGEGINPIPPIQQIGEDNIPVVQQRPITPPLAVRRPRRDPKPPGEWWKVKPSVTVKDVSEHELDLIDRGFEEVEFAGLTGTTEPRTFAQASKSPDAPQWIKAAQEEINSLYANGTWEVVKLPPGKKAIGSGWVFKVKRNADGSVERYKARVVAKGYSQRPGLDYTEIFAPTFRQASL